MVDLFLLYLEKLARIKVVTCPSWFYISSLPTAPGRGESQVKGEMHTSGCHCFLLRRAPGHGMLGRPGGAPSHAWWRAFLPSFLFKPRVASREGREQQREKAEPIFPVQQSYKTPSCQSLGFIHPERRALHEFINEVFSQFTNVYTSQSWDHQRS